MDETSRQVAQNTQDLNNGQRRGFNVRVNGEEHSAKARQGAAHIWFPMDGQLMNVAECAFKLIINDGYNQGTDTNTDPCKNWKYGTNTYASLDEWKARYPIGASVNVDCTYGCTCWDYASAFWRSQVNRNLETGNSMAWGTWVNKRAVNAGTEFETLTDWMSIRPGDWVVWGMSGTGHIAMAMSCAESPTGAIIFWQQSGDGTTGGSPIFRSAETQILGANRFLGAFRFKNWKTPGCGTIA